MTFISCISKKIFFFNFGKKIWGGNCDLLRFNTKTNSTSTKSTKSQRVNVLSILGFKQLANLKGKKWNAKTKNIERNA